MNQPSLRYLVIGSLVFLLAGLGLTAVLPGIEPVPPTPSAGVYNDAQLAGRAVYIREGCVYCHTQQVRRIEVETGTVRVKGDIGPESVAGDYAFQKPVLWGTERQGPDLARVASRPPGNSRDWQVEHLRNPQLFNPGTLMPSYAHLSDQELLALADYLLTLR